METLNDYFVHLKAMFFFVNKEMTERIPWKVTLNKGIIPHRGEWLRLQEALHLTVTAISENEFTKLIQIRQKIEELPQNWMTEEEFKANQKFLKFKLKKI